MTTKNLTEISELMTGELLAYKKCCNYVSQTQDLELKQLLGKYANNHKNRFEELLDYLKSHV